MSELTPPALSNSKENQDTLDPNQSQIPSNQAPAIAPKDIIALTNSVLNRLRYFTACEPALATIESEILLSVSGPQVAVKDKLAIYDLITDKHIQYLETLRKMYGQISVEELARKLGDLDLYLKLSNLSQNDKDNLGTFAVQVKSNAV